MPRCNFSKFNGDFKEPGCNFFGERLILGTLEPRCDRSGKGGGAGNAAQEMFGHLLRSAYLYLTCSTYLMRARD